MENPNTAKTKSSKSSGKHSLIKCPECDKEMRSDNLPRHIRVVHNEEVKGSEALPSITPPSN